MGSALLDQYSLLHAAVGVLAYFWNVPLWIATVIHVAFEIIENTQWGIRIINTYMIETGLFGSPVKVGWPGEKRRADSLLNQTGDTVTFVLGWVAAWALDLAGKRGGWAE
jgi:hypothetical protein